MKKKTELILPTKATAKLPVATAKANPQPSIDEGSRQEGPDSLSINISLEKDDESDDQENAESPLEPVDQETVKVKTLEQIRMEKVFSSTPEYSEQPPKELPQPLQAKSICIVKRNGFKAGDKRPSFRRKVADSTGRELAKVSTPKNSLLSPSKVDFYADEEPVNVVIKSLDQIRKERGEISSEQPESNQRTQTLKENQTANLLKRLSPEEDSAKPNPNAKPIKLRRNRLRNHEFDSDEAANNNDSKDEPLCEEKSSIDFDDLLLEGDTLTTSTSVPLNLEDDELMREIDQVINS